MNSTQQTLPSSNNTERQWAMGVHVGALVMAILTSWAAGVAGAVVAGVIWLLKRNESEFVAEHARAALNFNTSM